MNHQDIKLNDIVWIGISAPWFIGALGGFLILISQFLALVRHGEWVPFSAIDLLRKGFDAEWLYAPTDWIGLYKAFEWLHGGLFAAIAGGIVFLFLASCIAPLMEKGQ
jgi:hypothetical protein